MANIEIGVAGEIPTILKKILARKREEVIERKARVPLERLQEMVADRDVPRDFVQALQIKIDQTGTAVIAEIKKASPSKGVIREKFDVIAIARSYQAGGAACLSVLTDIDFFQGCDDYISQAKGATQLPVLRKDFIIDSYQVHEALAIGADCVLLIAAALDPVSLRALHDAALACGLAVLVEVHDQRELLMALELSTPLIGINNRNLHTFETDLDTTFRLLDRIPENRLIVTESGIRRTEDVAAMRGSGVNAFLVGEAFMRASDPGSALKNLFS